jgi:hypothetical protein
MGRKNEGEGQRTRNTLQRHTHSDLLPATKTHFLIPHLAINSSMDEFIDEVSTLAIQSPLNRATSEVSSL